MACLNTAIFLLQVHKQIQNGNRRGMRSQWECRREIDQNGDAQPVLSHIAIHPPSHQKRAFFIQAEAVFRADLPDCMPMESLTLFNKQTTLLDHTTVHTLAGKRTACSIPSPHQSQKPMSAHPKYFKPQLCHHVWANMRCKSWRSHPDRTESPNSTLLLLPHAAAKCCSTKQSPRKLSRWSQVFRDALPVSFLELPLVVVRRRDPVLALQLYTSGHECGGLF